MVAPWRDNRWKEWLPWLLAANVYRSCFDYPMSYSKPESFFEFCRVCSALVGVKQYHKPTMTGNGKFLTPIKKIVKLGDSLWHCFTHSSKKRNHGQLHPAAQVSISRARDHSTLGGELAVQVWTWRDWNSVQRGGVHHGLVVEDGSHSQLLSSKLLHNHGKSPCFTGKSPIMTGWWFGTCFIFHNIWDNPSH